MEFLCYNATMTCVNVLAAIVAEAVESRQAALCAIVGTRGSTPQPAGTIVCVDSAAQMTGSLGGGCMEAEVRRAAHQLLKKNRSETLTFKLDNDFGHDDGMICGGELDVAIQICADPSEIDPPRAALAELKQGRATTLAVRVQGAGGLVEYRIALESVPHLVLAGAGHIARSLATMAVMSGFDVSVIDERPDLNHSDRFPAPINPVVGDIAKTLADWPIGANTFVVIVTRGHRHDESALAAVLDSPARFIGMIGSKRKIKVIFDDLRHAGANEERLARVHAPIGVDIGAVTADEIAVSIAAQLIAERRKDYRSAVEGPFPVSAESI